jgi:hypothetical protein
VGLRTEIGKYLGQSARSDTSAFTELTVSNIKDKIPARDIQFLSIFDMWLTGVFNFGVDITTMNPKSSRDRVELDGYRDKVLHRLNDSVSGLSNTRTSIPGH